MLERLYILLQVSIMYFLYPVKVSVLSQYTLYAVGTHVANTLSLEPVLQAHSTSHVMLQICNPGLTKFSVISGIQMSVTVLSISLAWPRTPFVTPMLICQERQVQKM